MSKDKKNKKVKIKKSEIEKNPSSISNFDNSVLSNYSKWREDYTEDKSNEVKDEDKNIIVEESIVEDVQEEKKSDTDFTSNLINSEITDETFTGNIEVNDEKEQVDSTDNSEISEEEIPDNLDSEETVVEVEEKSTDEAEEKDEILTETLRLKLIYGNVTPLYERRKLGQKFDKNVKSEANGINSKSDNKFEKEVEKEKHLDILEKIDKENSKENTKKSKKDLKEVTGEDMYQMPKIPKALKFLFALTMTLGILVVGFFGMKAYYSLNVKFPNILEAVEKKDKTFYKTMIVYNGNENPTDQQVNSFIENLNENGDNLDFIKKWIKEDAENLKKDPEYVSKRPIRLQKAGKIYGLFDEYKIYVDPVKLKVEKSDKVDTFILLNDKEEQISIEEYSLFPGNYTIFYNDNGVKLKNSIKLFPTENNELFTVTYGEDTDYEIANETIKLDLNAKDSNFRIVTRDEQSIIFVNDKNTGLTVKDYNSLSGTNIKQGDEIKVVTKMPWGYNISEGVKYSGERSLTVSNSLSDPKLLDVAISKSLKLLKEDVAARGAKDETLLTLMVDDALDYAKRRIQGLVSSNRNYLGGFVSMEFDLNSYEIRPYKDTYEMYIGGHLLVQETTYPDGSNPPEISNVDSDNQKIGIHFIFDNEKKDWYCNVWGYTTRYITRKNIKSFDISKDMIVK